LRLRLRRGDESQDDNHRQGDHSTKWHHMDPRVLKCSYMRASASRSWDGRTDRHKTISTQGKMKPVALPPGRAKLSTRPAPTGSAAIANTIGTVRVACSSGAAAALPFCEDDVRCEGCQFPSVSVKLRSVGCGPPRVEAHIAADIPAQERQRLHECSEADLKFRIVRGSRKQHTDAPHSLGLLRARHEWPRSRSAEQRYELAPVHSITSSARLSSDGGTSRPSALAVLRLITSSNFVGRSIGRSPGLAPLRILSTKTADRR
jgi:hypothetical protein